MRTRLLALVGGAILVSGATGGCQQDPAIKPVNQIPIADARVIRNGESVNARMEGGTAVLAFPYNNAPVTITLDASHSKDPDGTVVAYHWLSATLAPDGGIKLPDGGGLSLRWIPQGAPLNWPGDDVQPQVMLGEGSWSFDLWVVDNLGAISNPDTITITVGNVVSPQVQQCADAVLPTEPESCRLCLCNQGAMCRAAAVMTACDPSCWGLVNCIAAQCPNFMAMEAKMDYSCATTSCAAYGSGTAGATAIAPCVNACAKECTGAAGDGGTDDSGGGASGTDSGGASGTDSGGDAGDGAP